jgi:hypothetical protein
MLIAKTLGRVTAHERVPPPRPPSLRAKPAPFRSSSQLWILLRQAGPGRSPFKSPPPPLGGYEHTQKSGSSNKVALIAVA